MDQISEGGRSIHEIDKIRKRLEAEKMELQAALELTQVRQEIERRIAEKDEEFLSTKKNFTKGIDGMQTALEQEAKAKAEALRMKKKLEADVSELETALEEARTLLEQSDRARRITEQELSDTNEQLS